MREMTNDERTKIIQQKQAIIIVITVTLHQTKQVLGTCTCIMQRIAKCIHSPKNIQFFKTETQEFFFVNQRIPGRRTPCRGIHLRPSLGRIFDSW